MSSGCIPKELQHHLRNSEPALVESLASSRCIGLNQLQSVGQEATPLPVCRKDIQSWLLLRFHDLLEALATKLYQERLELEGINRLDEAVKLAREIFSHGAIRQASRKPAPSKPAGFAAAEIELPAAEEMAGAQDLLRLAKPQSDSDMVLGWINSRATDDSQAISADAVTKSFLEKLVQDLAAAMGSKIEPSITITKAGLFNQCREMLDDLMATEPEIQLLSVLTKLQTGAGNEWAAPKGSQTTSQAGISDIGQLPSNANQPPADEKAISAGEADKRTEASMLPKLLISERDLRCFDTDSAASPKLAAVSGFQTNSLISNKELACPDRHANNLQGRGFPFKWSIPASNTGSSGFDGMDQQPCSPPPGIHVADQAMGITDGSFITIQEMMKTLSTSSDRTKDIDASAAVKPPNHLDKSLLRIADLESIEEIHSKGQESADSITERVQANFPSVNMQFMLNNHNQNGQSEADCRRHLSQSLMELGAIHATIRKGLEVKQQIHVDNPSAVNAMVSALLVTCHALAFNMLLSRLVSHFKPSHLAAVGGACGATAIATACLVPTAEAEQASPKGQTAATALDPNEWRAFKVQSIDTGGPPNTNRYRFSLPDPNQEVGLPVASCLVTRAAIGSEKEDGSRKFVIRPYTPTSPKDAKGYFDLVIKVYPQGNMSKHIGDLKEGDVLECKGPIEKFAYKPNMKKAIGMIAGGSGITPMLQVASEVLRNPQDKTEVSLIFANQTEQDIILREEIDAMADKHKNFKVHYTIDKVADGGPPEGWKGSVGYVTKEMAKANIPPPSDDNLILVCGPPPMYKALSGEKAKDKSQGELTGMLKDMGYTEKQVYKF
ncbi:hypothetical protein WJX74_009690 [Apatococcus lobatus]|uniref:cytochrome-b5 reductase n=1 Tax=Apatococcus lobatus TaxID=904363 RepID=A0AAW1QD94_9CHLO